MADNKLTTQTLAREAMGTIFTITVAHAHASTSSSADAGIELDTNDSSVRALADDVRLDLGGIGKGFALDRMAAVVTEWDIQSALLWASTSTVLAKWTKPDAFAWSVSIGPEHDRQKIMLVNSALSASGTGVQDDHIIDPRSGHPVRGRARCWAKAPSATESDALSTAFMVMSDTEIMEYCKQHPHVSSHILQ